ncbi:MAG: extracellular solute-binding protein [Clostridia bacterium]|nr:extracellular solute-binding protein [Clostridia bacterium]
MKKFLCILLVFVMVFMLSVSLTACHGSLGLKAFEMPEEFDTAKTFEITFWAKNDTNKTQKDIYNQAIKEFQEIYPNIRVNMRLYTDYTKIYNDVITNISTGTTPNVCITYPDHIATYKTGNDSVIALDEIMVDKKYGLGGSEVKFDSPGIDEIVPSFLNECIIDGTYYAVPYLRSTEACYINKTYVEKLGFKVPDVLTWDWIWKVSEAATAQDEDGVFKVNGQKVMIPFIYKSTDNMMIQMTEQLGSGYSNESGEILLFNDRTKELLYEIGEHAGSKAFSTFKISSYPANFLNAGQAIFAIDSTAGATWMGSDAPLIDIPESTLVRFETVIREIPQFDVNNKKMISQGPSICIFNKADSQEVLASWLFAQFLLTNDVQIPYSETEGYLPVTTKAQNSAEYIDYLSREGEDNNAHYAIKIQASKLLLNNLENTFTTPVFNGSASLREAAGSLIENVAKSKRRGDVVDDSYIEKLYSDTMTLYRLDQIGGNTPESFSKDLGPLPKTAVALIVTLVTVWVIIGAFALLRFIKSKRAK